MVRIAEVSGQTPDREQRPPADRRGKRAGAKQPESEETDLLTLGADVPEAEPTEPDAPPAEQPTDEPEADADAPPPDADGIDLLA